MNIDSNGLTRARKGMFNRNPVNDYHEVIENRARQGWKLIQVLAPPLKGYGKASFFELIFERKVEE